VINQQRVRTTILTNLPKLPNLLSKEENNVDTTKDMTKPDTTRPKRLSAEGIGKAINFSPTLKQRTCFDALMARTGKTQARLGREAITMYLESQGFSKADQGIEE